MWNDRDAVIVAATRSPIGRVDKGSLAHWRADDMAAAVVAATLAKVPEVAAETIEDVVVGCSHPGESGHNIARNVALLAGIEAPGTTVCRYCASSLQALRVAAHAVKADEGDCFVVAGVEANSRREFGGLENWPRNERFVAAGARTEELIERGEFWSPDDSFPDIHIQVGQTAENVRVQEGVTRQEMDEFALLSHQRAVASRDNGVFDAEITPLTDATGVTASKDDSPRADTSLEKLAALKPAFRPDGEVTAGNSCPVNDGAAALVVLSGRRCRELGLQPLARVVASGVSSLRPEIMGLGPIEASRQAMKRAGLSSADIDLFEINEAFAAQVIPSARHLGIDYDRLNVHGGGIALGHPGGMTGARIMTTLLNALRVHDKTFGLETMCVGGGQGMAMIVERLS